MVVFLLAAFILSASFSPAEAWHHRDNWREEVTPYGDFCDSCGDYGTCDKPMTHEVARKAVIDYYNKKGLNVMLENKRGRFIKAKIMEKDRVVDVIILDRKTGRIRSIY